MERDCEIRSGEDLRGQVTLFGCASPLVLVNVRHYSIRRLHPVPKLVY